MKSLLFIVFISIFVNLKAIKFPNSTALKEYKFEKNSNILDFLDKNNIPQSVYYDLKSNDKEILSDITEGSLVYILLDGKNDISQALIQINEMIQLRIHKNESGEYVTDIIPIAYERQTKLFHADILYSPYKSVVSVDSSLSDLAEEFKAVFFNSIDFNKDIRIGDTMSIVYEEKFRLSKKVASPRIKSALITVQGNDYYVFYHKNRYYDEKGNLLNKVKLLSPVRGRATSNFSLKRYHPVLKRYRAHHGIDYGSRKNTRIKSAMDGRVSFKGNKGGYGKTVTIQHKSGYKTLYAHMNKFSPYIYKNKYIKSGTYIGNVGNTGLSTGYHLHFGLYKNGRPVNPKSFIDHGQFRLKGKELRRFKMSFDKYKHKMLNASYGISRDVNLVLLDK